MKLFKKVLDFLFGKEPDIFDEAGQIQHRFSQKKWNDWKNKSKSDPSYNWRQHSGTKAH